MSKRLTPMPGSRATHEFLAAMLKTGGGNVVTVLIGAATMKILAVVIGPAGVGLWSVLKQIQITTVMLGTCNGGVSLVRGVSALDSEEREKLIQTTAFIYVALGSFVISILVFSAPYLSVWLGRVSTFLVIFMALPVAVAIARSFLSSVLNGYLALGRLVLTQIGATAAGAVSAYPLALWIREGHEVGLVILSIITASVAVLLATAIIRHTKLMQGIRLRLVWHRESAHYFIKVAGVMVIMGLASGLSLLVARGLVVRHGGLEDAGLFDASWTLGSVYLGLLMSSIGIYYLPKLSASGHVEQAQLVRRAARFSTIVALPVIAGMITLKPLIVALLYSSRFMPTLEMFRWMLIGDYLKVSGYLLAIVLLANGRAVEVLWNSVIWDIGLVVAVYISMRYGLGLGKIGMSITLLNGGSLLYYYGRVSHLFPIRTPARLRVVWSTGLFLILLLSAAVWRSKAVIATDAILGIGSATLLSYLLLYPSEVTSITKFFSAKFRK